MLDVAPLLRVGGHKVSVVLPAFNEELSLGAVLAKLMPLAKQNGWEVIVVDDGSTDNTARIALSNGARVVAHSANRGYGASLKSGIRAASGEWVVTLDSDGQHDPADIQHLLQQRTGAEVILGVRSGQSNTSKQRNVGRWLIRHLASYLLGRQIPDLNCGMNAALRDYLHAVLPILPAGYSFSSTITLVSLGAGMNVSFVPVRVSPRAGGNSAMRLLRDGFEFLYLVCRTIALCNPLRFFIPLAVYMVLLGLTYACWGIVVDRRIPIGAALAILMAALGFFCGFLADQIAALRLELAMRGLRLPIDGSARHAAAEEPPDKQTMAHAR